MSQLTKEIFEEGETVSAGQLNQINTDLSNDNVNDDNTAPGWITKRHIDPAIAINSLYDYSNDTTTTTSYNNTAYQVISQGGNNCEITNNFTLNANETLRLQACGMISTNIMGTYGDGPQNYFAFRILING